MDDDGWEYAVYTSREMSTGKLGDFCIDAQNLKFKSLPGYQVSVKDEKGSIMSYMEPGMPPLRAAPIH